MNGCLNTLLESDCIQPSRGINVPSPAIQRISCSYFQFLDLFKRQVLLLAIILVRLAC